ncbi:hypothetical protein ACET3Z_027361 [Daucus carota]
MIGFLRLLQQEEARMLLKDLLLALLPSLLLLFLVKWLFFNATVSNKKLPPSPSRLPVLGNFLQLGLVPQRNLWSMAPKHGPFMLLHFGSVPTLVLSSAGAAREVMKVQDIMFCDRPESSVGRRMLYDRKDISAASYGEYWRQLKSIFVLQLGSNKRVQKREEETGMNKIKEMSVSSLPVDLSELFLTLNNDISCAFSFRDFIPWLGWVDRITGLDARLDRVSKQLDEFLQNVVQEHLHLGESNIQTEHKEDFVDILLRIQKETTHGISIDNDSVKAILLKEIEVLGCRTDITDKDFEKMQYLKAVIKETLCLHPPVPLLIPRSAREDVKVNGYDIAARIMVITNAWAIGRDPETWDEPEEFLPKRFLNFSIDIKGRDF